jgi:type IV fimbrial biogenesis protein FimT
MSTPHAPGPTRARRRGVTLVELLVVLAVAAILALVAAPSFNDFIRVQRLKGVANQLMTDLQFARAEAASRNRPVQIRFSENESRSCYIIFVGATNRCRCTSSPMCAADATEVRSVSVARRQGVRIVVPEIADVQFVTSFEFDPTTGGIRIAPSDARGQRPTQFVVDAQIDNARRYRAEVKLSGRPGLCKPAGSTMDVPAC